MSSADYSHSMRFPDRIEGFGARLPKTKAALAYARRLHEGQRRAADGAPFIEHPTEVGELLYKAGAADEVIAAGLLHDALEKTAATAYELSARFGHRVGEIVGAVSDDSRIVEYSRRKAALRDQVAKAGDDALAVFAADKLSEVRELRLGDGLGVKVRARRLKNYRLALAMLEKRLPDSPLVSALAVELDALPPREPRGPLAQPDDPDAAAYANGAALPNPGAKLAGPSFEEWLAAAKP